jgi:hypothetical protein
MHNGKSGTGCTRRVTRIINPLNHDCGKNRSELQQTEHIRSSKEMFLRWIFPYVVQF